MTCEKSIISEKFEELKKKAAEKSNKDVADSLSDCVDRHYFYSLSALFQLGRLGAYSGHEIDSHLVQLYNRYTADKGTYLRWAEIARQDKERRMKASTLLTQLTKNADSKSDEELLELFAEIISCTFDEVTAKIIKEKIISRSDEKMLLICKNEAESFIRDLLLSLRIEADDAAEMISAAKRNGMSAFGGYKITYEGDRFNLYRLPGVILC